MIVIWLQIVTIQPQIFQMDRYNNTISECGDTDYKTYRENEKMRVSEWMKYKIKRGGNRNEE